MTEPTDAEIRGLAATGNGVYQDDETAIWEITDPSLMKLVHAALTKWGTPAHSGEPVAWLDPWAGTKVTTDYDAYGKHGIPLYTTPQPTQAQALAVPLTDEQIESLLWKYGYDPDDEHMAAMLKEVHGIKGGQHGAE